MIERVMITPGALAAPLAEALAVEHPTAKLVACDGSGAGSLEETVDVDLAPWGDPTWDPGPFDWSLGDRAWTRPVLLRVNASGLEPAPAADLLERLLTRVQRFIDRRNVDSNAPVFDRVLRRHRALHDRRFPLVRADHDHAMDTWRWTLRLAPQASLALQLAALFHDIERLTTEAHARVEQHAADYVAFKVAHARVGAAIARRALSSAGLDAAVIAQVEALVACHERPSDDQDEERALLTCADALSFFSLNASGFLDYYGEAHTRTKLAYTLARLRPAHHPRLRELHVRHDVAALLARELERGPDVALRRTA